MEQINKETALMPLVNDEEPELIDVMTSRTLAYCSFKPQTEEDKILLYNLTNTPEKHLKDEIKDTIAVKDVFVEMIPMMSQKTGEIKDTPRIVLIDDKGVGHTCVSTGVYGSLRKIFISFGAPETWKKPIKVVPILINKSADRSILTLNVVK